MAKNLHIMNQSIHQGTIVTDSCCQCDFNSSENPSFQLLLNILHLKLRIKILILSTCTIKQKTNSSAPNNVVSLEFHDKNNELDKQIIRPRTFAGLPLDGRSAP